MTKKQWYESLFENYGQKYDDENFTQGTVGECDFIEGELKFDKSLKILDVGCGTGRHAIELTKRGYPVTGIDLSETQIKRAREKAAEEYADLEEEEADKLLKEGEAKSPSKAEDGEESKKREGGKRPRKTVTKQKK